MEPQDDDAMSDLAYDYLFKIVFLGNPGVGKTSLLSVFMDPTHGFYAETSNTVGIEFKVKTLDAEGARVKLQIWDTAGQERFNMPISPTYVRGASGYLTLVASGPPKAKDILLI